MRLRPYPGYVSDPRSAGCSLLTPLPIGLRALLVVPCALLLVRGFVFYHDVLHGAIFRDSRLGRALVTALGLYFIYSSSIWRARHNAHHRRIRAARQPAASC